MSEPSPTGWGEHSENVEQPNVEVIDQDDGISDIDTIQFNLFNYDDDYNAFKKIDSDNCTSNHKLPPSDVVSQGQFNCPLMCSSNLDKFFRLTAMKKT